MLKKTITYTDYNDTEKTEDFYFNLDKAEVMKMYTDSYGNLTDMIQEIVDAKDQAKIMDTFEMLVLNSYGKKTPDGRFIKNDEIREDFKHTAAYPEIFMELATNDEAASEFVNGILPKNLDADVNKIYDNKANQTE